MIVVVFSSVQSNIYHLLDVSVAIPLTNAGPIQASHERPASLKICTAKPGKKMEYKGREAFRKKEDREGRKRRKTASTAYPPLCRSFSPLPQNKIQTLF